MQLTPGEEEKFEKMSKLPNIKEMIANSVAPSICASDKDNIAMVKKAVACLLFGGSPKHLHWPGSCVQGLQKVSILGYSVVFSGIVSERTSRSK